MFFFISDSCQGLETGPENVLIKKVSCLKLKAMSRTLALNKYINLKEKLPCVNIKTSPKLCKMIQLKKLS